AFQVPSSEITASQERVGLSLVLTFFGPVRKTLASIQSALGRIWGLQGRIRLFPAGFGLFQCYFQCVEDRNRILRSQPWNMDGTMMHLAPWSPPSDELALSLRFMDLWVTLRDIPTELTTVTFGRQFLADFGVVLDVALFRFSDEQGTFLRAKLIMYRETAQPQLKSTPARPFVVLGCFIDAVKFIASLGRPSLSRRVVLQLFLFGVFVGRLSAAVPEVRQLVRLQRKEAPLKLGRFTWTTASLRFAQVA
ncbi:hypothetical protein LINPERHAP2_LOCUS29169, partial [Linum perenne]